MAQAPLLLMLEFARAEQGGDPFAFRFDTQEYLVRSEGGAFKSARFSWDSQLLQNLELLRRPGRDSSLIQRIGQMLRRFLETTKWTQDEARILDAVKEGRRVMVSIRSAAAELYALPWELLTVESTGQHVGELPGVLLRYEWPETRSIPASGAHSGANRILVAWSAAAGAVPAGEHIAAIQKGNPRNSSPFDVTHDVLTHASCGRLSSALSMATLQGHPVAILHLLAHGSAGRGTFGIALNGDEPGDSAVVVDAGRLRQLLAPHASTLRMVVLAACDSGNSGALGNQLGSVAQALHRAGIAAVVASRYPLSVSGSIRLTESLYAELLTEGSSLESALLSARLRLAEDAAQLDWASLQLYARAADGASTRPIGRAEQGTSSVPVPKRSIKRISGLFLIIAFLATSVFLILDGSHSLVIRSGHNEYRKTPLSASTAGQRSAEGSVSMVHPPLTQPPPEREANSSPSDSMIAERPEQQVQFKKKEEFRRLLNFRADEIKLALKNSNDTRVLPIFQKLHEANLEAIKDDNLILSHELTRRIHKLLAERIRKFEHDALMQDLDYLKDLADSSRAIKAQESGVGKRRNVASLRWVLIERLEEEKFLQCYVNPSAAGLSTRREKCLQDYEHADDLLRNYYELATGQRVTVPNEAKSRNSAQPSGPDIQ